MTEDIEITPKKRRKLNLSRTDRTELLQKRQIELAVSYFLDLEQDRTVKQIAEEMGITVGALKHLTTTTQFQEVYDDAMMQLGHHPRLQALSTQLPELAPLAYQALKRMLMPGTAHTAQVSAIKLLFDTLSIGEQIREEDPAALTNFMQSKGVTVQNNNFIFNIPTEYRDAFQKWMGGEVVDANATDIPHALPAQSPTSESPEAPG
jgi:hypothetical protein